jgi:hypothetical protein
MAKMQIEKFLKFCGNVYKQKTPQLRWGQTLSMVFSYHYHKDIPEDVDPYYDDKKIEKFLDYVLEIE